MSTYFFYRDTSVTHELFLLKQVWQKGMLFTQPPFIPLHVTIDENSTAAPSRGWEELFLNICQRREHVHLKIIIKKRKHFKYVNIVDTNVWNMSYQAVADNLTYHSYNLTSLTFNMMM